MLSVKYSLRQGSALSYLNDEPACQSGLLFTTQMFSLFLPRSYPFSGYRSTAYFHFIPLHGPIHPSCMSLSRRATAFPPWQVGSHPILHRSVDGVLFSPVVRNAQSAYSNLRPIPFDRSGHWQHLALFKRRVWFVKGNRSDFACNFRGGIRMSWILCSQKATDRSSSNYLCAYLVARGIHWWIFLSQNVAKWTPIIY